MNKQAAGVVFVAIWYLQLVCNMKQWDAISILSTPRVPFYFNINFSVGF